MALSQNSDPRARARALIDKMGLRTAPVPVEKVAKLLGIQIRFSPLDQELSGMIYMQGDTAIIGVNSLHHPNRQRFTIAHEIGHHELHKEIISKSVHVDKQYTVLRRDSKSATGTDRLEVQANQFAAELLMPEALIAEFFKGRVIDIDDQRPLEELAKKFKVSRQMLEYRLSNS